MRFRLRTLLLIPLLLSPLLFAMSVANTIAIGGFFDPAAAFAACGVYSLVCVRILVHQSRLPSLRRTVFTCFGAGVLAGVAFAAQITVVQGISLWLSRSIPPGLLEAAAVFVMMFVLQAVMFGMTGALAGLIVGAWIANNALRSEPSTAPVTPQESEPDGGSKY